MQLKGSLAEEGSHLFNIEFISYMKGEYRGAVNTIWQRLQAVLRLL